MKRLSAFATLALAAAIGMPALSTSAQSRSEKVDQIASALSNGINAQASSHRATNTDARTGETTRATPAQLMRETLTSINLDAVPGKLALEIWSNQTNVPFVVNWKSLEAQGIDPTSPVTLNLSKVPAEAVLNLIIQQIHPDPIENNELLLDVQQWYVRVMTKEDALKRTTTKLYFLGDLLIDIPHFDNAPGFSLNDALNNTSSGGSGQGNASREGGLFDNDNHDERTEQHLTKAERAERIAQMIRDTIEPDIWRANGGRYSSVRYLRGMLVVKAPAFVHQQIGGSTGISTTKAKTQSKTSKRQSTHRASQTKQGNAPRGKRSTPGNVAGVDHDSPRPSR